MMPLSIRSALSMAVAALVLAYAAPAPAQDTIPPEDFAAAYPPLPQAEADAVRAVARDYIAAAHRRDGAAAARLVSRETRAYYTGLAQLAVSAPEARVRAAPLVERVMILMFRHRVPAGELRTLAGDAVFAYTVDNGWVTVDVEDPILTGTQAYGTRDRAVLRDRGEDVHFLREDGGWRWDMMPTIQAASTELAANAGMTEDEFVLFVLKYSDGRDPSPDIWQPLP
jgi:hypothetical protein